MEAGAWRARSWRLQPTYGGLMEQKTRGRPEAPSDGRGSCIWVVCNLRTPRRDRRRSSCGAARPAVSSAAPNGHLARFCLWRGKSGLSLRSPCPCPPTPAAAAAALYGDYRHSGSCLDARGARAGPVRPVGRGRIRAILGTIFPPPERQYASGEAFGTVSRGGDGASCYRTQSTMQI